MRYALCITAILAVSCCCLAQEIRDSKMDLKFLLLSPYYSKPHTTTDKIWSVTKPFGFVVGEIDAYTTAQQIKRGYVESNPMDNLLIPRDKPALLARSGLGHAENYGINLLLQVAYGRCGPSKFCKWTVIGTRGFFIGRGIVSIMHNNRLP
jgi:hypothetical protein